jgi:hypothetical protein
MGGEVRNISALLTLTLIAQNEVSIFRLHYANYHTHFLNYYEVSHCVHVLKRWIKRFILNSISS